MPGKGKKIKHGQLDEKITKAIVDDGQHKFGRLIEIKGNVTSLAVSEQLASTIANAMTDTPPDNTELDSEIPSGYTFFGQFIDHDLTLDDFSILGSAVDKAGRAVLRWCGGHARLPPAAGRTYHRVGTLLLD